MVRVMLYPCMFWVYLSMDLFVLCDCLLKQIAICLDMVVILLLNVMELFNMVVCALFDRPCMAFQSVCVLCL